MQDDQTPNTPGQQNPEDYKPAPDTQPSFGDPNPQTTPVTEQNPPQPAPESTTTEQTLHKQKQQHQLLKNLVRKVVFFRLH